MVALTLLCACSAGQAPRNSANETAAGNRLRLPTDPDPRTVDVAEDPTDCEAVEIAGGAETSPPRAPPRPDVLRNRIVVNARGQILWNDMAVDAPTLRQYLDVAAVVAPRPVTVVAIQPGADARVVAAVRDAISRALSCELVAY